MHSILKPHVQKKQLPLLVLATQVVLATQKSVLSVVSKELAAVMQKRHFISSDEESNEGTDLVIEETSEVVMETTSQVDQPPKPKRKAASSRGYSSFMVEEQFCVNMRNSKFYFLAAWYDQLLI